MRVRFSMFALCFGLFAAACGTATELDSNDLTAEDDAVADDGDKADGLAATATYYSVRNDTRRCVSPLCGGYWVKRVNFSTTKCLDGSWQAECYVVDFELEGRLGLNERTVQTARDTIRAGKALVRGKLHAKTFAPGGKLAMFTPSEVWTSISDQAPSGLFFKVSDSGIRCITVPCFSLHAAKANSTSSRQLSALDLTATGADEATQDKAWNDLDTTGLLVAGTLVNFREGPGTGRRLDATQAYIELAPRPAPATE